MTLGKILRIGAAGYSAIMAVFLIIFALTEIWGGHGIMASPPPTPWTISDEVFLLLWLGCVAFTGWSAFNREVKS